MYIIMIGMRGMVKIVIQNEAQPRDYRLIKIMPQVIIMKL